LKCSFYVCVRGHDLSWTVDYLPRPCHDARMSGRVFKGLRLEIAIVLNGQRRTLYETAKALGLRSGDVQKTLRQMHVDGILEASEAEPVRGTEFWLAHEHEDALAEALGAGDGVPGLLQGDQDLLIVRAPSKAALDGVLGRDDLIVAVAWAARLGGGGDMLLAIAPDAPDKELGRLQAMLEKAEIKVSQYRTAKVLGASALRANVDAAKEVGASNPT
jgi:hypothetical protein